MRISVITPRKSNSTLQNVLHGALSSFMAFITQIQAHLRPHFNHIKTKRKIRVACSSDRTARHSQNTGHWVTEASSSRRRLWRSTCRRCFIPSLHFILRAVGRKTTEFCLAFENKSHKNGKYSRVFETLQYTYNIFNKRYDYNELF